MSPHFHLIITMSLFFVNKYFFCIVKVKSNMTYLFPDTKAQKNKITWNKQKIYFLLLFPNCYRKWYVSLPRHMLQFYTKLLSYQSGSFLERYIHTQYSRFLSTNDFTFNVQHIEFFLPKISFSFRQPCAKKWWELQTNASFLCNVCQ